MFVDQVIIYCQAGDGGNGCCSFRRESKVPRGGPDGGRGGDGGSVIIRAERNLGSLGNIAGHRHWNADRGRHGEGGLRTGRTGEDTVILVPHGTIVRDAKHGHILRDLQNEGDSVIVAKGGIGGRGNRHFATSTNRTPREFEPGTPGEYREVILELKLIADVGLLGKPNAGKSTLLACMTRATPEIANYPFTTKHPNLGLVRKGFDREFVMADIPGLIEGAHAGIGLGHEFLKHVERTRILIHLVEPTPMDQTDPIENYKQIREELRLYNASLDDVPELICISKSELPDAEPLAELFHEETGHEVMLISSITGANIDQLTTRILELLRSLDDADEGPSIRPPAVALNPPLPET